MAIVGGLEETEESWAPTAAVSVGSVATTTLVMDATVVAFSGSKVIVGDAEEVGCGLGWAEVLFASSVPVC